MGRALLQTVILFVLVSSAFVFGALAGVVRLGNLAFIATGTGLFLIAAIRASEAYRWWLGRARCADSDGSGALVFDDGTLGRTEAPAVEGRVRVFDRRHEAKAAGYRDDADPQRFRIQLVSTGDARVKWVRDFALRLAAASLVCCLGVGAFWVLSPRVVSVVGTSCCASTPALPDIATR